MAFGQSCKCSACDFTLCSGHSHHSGSSAALCGACLARFELPTRDAWGPEVGELIELHTVHRMPGGKRRRPTVEWQLKPTGEYLLAEPLGDGRFVRYAIEDARCPCCKESGRLVTDFETGDSCPACGGGTLACDPVIY